MLSHEAKNEESFYLVIFHKISKINVRNWGGGGGKTTLNIINIFCRMKSNH